MVRARSWVLMLAAAAGCSAVRPEQGFMQNCHNVVRHAGVGSARAQRNTLFPWLRSDVASIRYLARAADAGYRQELREELKRLLTDGEQLGREITHSEMLRLPEDGVDELHAAYFVKPPVSAARRRKLTQRYDQDSKDALAVQLDWIKRQTDSRQMVERARAILVSFQPAAQHRDGGHQDIVTMRWGWLGMVYRDQYRKNMRNWKPGTTFEQTLVWRPDTSRSDAVRARLDKALPEDLLAYYAPIIVQQVASKPPYAPDADRIGELTLEPDWMGQAQTKVDTTKPTAYGYWQKRRIHGAERYQLTYTFWYPERPALMALDVDAGRLDGKVVRLTLDRENRPAIYETMSASGLSHQFYPTSRLENMARKEYGAPVETQAFSLADLMPEPHVGPIIRMVVPGAGASAGAATRPSDYPRRAVVYCSAGHHLCEAMRDSRDFEAPTDPAKCRAYRLAPYQQLETIKLLGRYYSTFDADGLVRGAGRLSGWPPRQRGTQALHLNETDFDDPDLLDKYLRLPREF